MSNRSTLSTLQARTAIEAVKKTDFNVQQIGELKKIAGTIYKDLIKRFPKNYPADVRRPLIALVLSSVGMKAVQEKQVSEIEYLKLLAYEKEKIERICSDYGAFGDMVEILARIALIDNFNLVKANMLKVKKFGAVDVNSKKYGKLEIGHNGKTLTQATLFDYMAGDYESILYGMFDEQDKQKVYAFCKKGNIGPALQIVSERMVYWNNKYDFQTDMDNLTSGKGITEKGQDIQVVYNPSKYRAFTEAIKKGKLIPLCKMYR